MNFTDWYLRYYIKLDVIVNIINEINEQVSFSDALTVLDSVDPVENGVVSFPVVVLGVGNVVGLDVGGVVIGR